MSAGKTRKKSVLQQQQDNQFDIAAALKSRRPLRKTTTATMIEGLGTPAGGDSGGNLQQQLQSRMKGRKLSTERGDCHFPLYQHCISNVHMCTLSYMSVLSPGLTATIGNGHLCMF